MWRRRPVGPSRCMARTEDATARRHLRPPLGRGTGPYAWDAPNAVIAARHNLRLAEVLRFDLNTVAARAALVARGDDPGARRRRAAGVRRPLLRRADAPPGDLLRRGRRRRSSSGQGPTRSCRSSARPSSNPGDAVAVTAPTYPFHALRPQQLGAVVRTCPLGAEFAPDVEQVARRRRRARSCSSSARRTTRPATRSHPAWSSAIVAGSPCPVVLDEAYAEFAGWSAIPMLARYPQLIIVRTMSKRSRSPGCASATPSPGPDAIDLLTGSARPTASASSQRASPPPRCATSRRWRRTSPTSRMRASRWPRDCAPQGRASTPPPPTSC